MDAPPSLFTRLYSWLIGKPTIRQTNLQVRQTNLQVRQTNLQVRQTNLQVLKIPADGSPPHLIQLNTIDVASEGNVDCFLRHIPDFRPYWGTQEGFRWRDVAEVEVGDQSLPELNGVYIGWKSYAVAHMPVSEHTGFCGDAFIAKTPVWERDVNGAVYEDIPVMFLRSPLLLGTVLERLHDI